MEMKYKKYDPEKIMIAVLSFLLAALLTGIVVDQEQEVRTARAQENLAQEVLRFHILANSDEDYDQELKVQVRDLVLSWIEEHMPERMDVDGTKMWLKEHSSEMELLCENEIQAKGYDYPVSVAVTTCYFPEKCYGDVTFPAGNYEALRIEIGAADGHNWWCVLYPNLCFIDAVRAVVPEESKMELQQVLAEDTYDVCTENAEIKVKSYFLERFFTW